MARLRASIEVKLSAIDKASIAELAQIEGLRTGAFVRSILKDYLRSRGIDNSEDETPAPPEDSIK